MRLINTGTLELQDFSLKTIPPYAILSHTWGTDEITFQDTLSQKVLLGKGYIKIQQSCLLARKRGLEFAWVDTCCIDKTSSAELTESINLMYQWYRDATVCFVYLEDLKPDAVIKDALPHCRWFTREWTLQEFIALKDMAFYDMAWNHKGTKISMFNFLSKFTKIPPDILKRSGTLYNYSVASRMTWAAHRETTRIEDTAYCLLGIFDVDMPLIYREGIKAFRRLQEEIVKRSNDMTIFAWQGNHSFLLDLFASSPKPFIDCGITGIGRLTSSPVNFTVTNRDLLVSGKNSLVVSALQSVDRRDIIRYVFLLSGMGYQEYKGIYLRKLGPNLFYRDGQLPLAEWTNNNERKLMVNATGFHILTDTIDPVTFHFASSAYRELALHIPKSNGFSLEDTVPEDLWDASGRVFLVPDPNMPDRYPMVLAMRFQCNSVGASIDIIALCDMTNWRSPTCKLFKQGDHAHLEATLFNQRNRNESIYWAGLQSENSDILRLRNDYVDIKVDDQTFHIAVTFHEVPAECLLDSSEWLSAMPNGAVRIMWYSMDFIISKKGDI
jgi:hypothetical protein